MAHIFYTKNFLGARSEKVNVCFPLQSFCGRDCILSNHKPLICNAKCIERVFNSHIFAPQNCWVRKTQKVDFCFPFQFLHTKIITHQNDRRERTKRFVFTIMIDYFSVSVLYKGPANLPGYRVRLFHLIQKKHFFLIYYFENFQYFSDFEKFADLFFENPIFFEI